MKQFSFLSLLMFILLGNSPVLGQKNSGKKQNNPSMITHSVIFKLKHPQGSVQEKTFLEAAARLAEIPGVEKFEMLRQISSKNKFEYGLSMQFSNNDEYQSYNHHPSHEQFLKDFWFKDVEDFLEIDYQSLK